MERLKMYNEEQLTNILQNCMNDLQGSHLPFRTITPIKLGDWVRVIVWERDMVIISTIKDLARPASTDYYCNLISHSV